MIALLILLFLSSCVKTEVINALEEPLTKADTTEYGCDSSIIDIEIDTTMIEEQHPIVFNPSVEDWEEAEDNDISI
jgi:hypothetical protein